MDRPLQIVFECLPLRSIGRLDVPLDATAEFRAQCERIRQAIAKHGLHNSFYLRDGRCVYQLTADPQIGLLEFAFEGTLLTDAEDRKTVHADLHVQLARETCDWLTQPVVGWFCETVQRAVMVEFDRFIAAGDLARTIQRLERIRSESDSRQGFVGFGL